MLITMRQNMIQHLSFGFIIFFVWGCGPALPPEVQMAMDLLPERIDFNRQVKPLLADRCYVCHGPDIGKREAGLRLDVAEYAYAELPENPGRRAIVPGSLRRSELVARILSTDPDYRMPAEESHLVLTARDKAVLLKWIRQGADYQPHWAFIRPQAPDLPDQVTNSGVIDYFIHQNCIAQGLSLQAEADKETLLRRLSLDLTGLPPTPEELDIFLTDRTHDAYEKQVDRLLASPHYGEKMAAEWLDVARYADTHGYTVDRARDMSPWRDWVIRTFNANMSYSDFITWQLAGDLLPNPTREQLIATGFNRNHQHNMEGGIVEEEFRVEYVADRVNTSAQAFMALTAGCARCHDHKFDPFTQKNYYELFAFFNQVKEAGQISWDNAMPVPTLLLTDSVKEKIIQFLTQKESQQIQQIKDLEKNTTPNYLSWLSSGGLKQIPANPQKYAGLLAYYPLTGGNLINRANPTQKGKMFREGNTPEQPKFAQDEQPGALWLDGDTWLDIKPTGKFRRSDPFTIALWVKIPASLKKGVLFHQGSMHLTYNFRGLHLALEDDRLQLLMAHTAPYNAIIQYTQADIPRDKWLQVTVTYDGSSRAQGYQLYLDGQRAALDVDQDLLYKDIVFENSAGQPALQFGAWERGKGLEGGKIRDIYVYNRELTPLEINGLVQVKTLDALRKADPQNIPPDLSSQLQVYHQVVMNKTRFAALQSLKMIRRALHDSIEPVPEMMIMQDMPEGRKTYLLDRGLYDAPKDEVQPGVPEYLLPFPDDYPRNRLGLAQWLTHPDHPLTARVAVNRFWQNIFGRGLVSSAEDFGNQGQLPSHPELLDWLAIYFREQGWDVKKLVKLLVMSETYRRSSVADEAGLERDPENIWLARGPAQRLTAEMLRDNALAASGLLNKHIGGPSVFPYQPEGLWSINGGTYRVDTGQNVYRRGLYTFWKRSVPNPTQATFDVGIRTNCTMTRQKTNTPLQALVLLNEPTFVEAARVMGEKMARQKDPATAITSAFSALTGRSVSDAEHKILLDLFNQQAAELQDPQKASGWLKASPQALPKEINRAEVAAYAVVASTIMNTDATITKR